jgi:glucokinase
VGYAVGADLGGTRLKAAAVTADGEVLETLTEATGEDDASLWTAKVREAVTRLQRAHGPARAIGVASPGLASRDGRSIADRRGRLSGLVGLRWDEVLGARVPVRVLNDAHAALLAEAWRGAAAGRRDVVLLTLGTGVGGAVLAGGRLVEGHLGRAGHLGHISLDVAGDRNPASGVPGTLEDAFGERTLARRSEGRFADTASLVEAFRAGDPDAARVWRAAIRALACGISSIVNVVDPEVVILGGGIASAGDALFEPLRAALDEVEWRPLGTGVKVVPATLGAQAGALGAARAAWDRVEAPAGT